MNFTFKIIKSIFQQEGSESMNLALLIIILGAAIGFYIATDSKKKK